MRMKRIKNKILHFTLVMVFLMPVIDGYVLAQGEKKLIRRGNKAFEKGDFKEAEIDYKGALERNASSPVGEFNLGGAVYEQENFEESATIFDNLSRRSLPDEQRAKSFHNLGNSLINLQQYQQAVEAYKNALRINPDDMDSKYNLLYAQQMLQEQEQQQQSEDQQQDDQQDDQQQQDQQQQEDNQQQDEQQQDQQKDQQQEQQTQENQQQNVQQQQTQDQAKKLSGEDAERMLQALQERERETLEKLKMEQFKSAKRVQSEKDW